MDDSVYRFLKIIFANLLLIAGIVGLYCAMPGYNKAASAVSKQISTRKNIVEVSTGIGVYRTIDEKESAQRPLMTPAEVYFDLISYEDNKTVQIGDAAHVYTTEQVLEFKESAKDGDGLITNAIALYLDNCNNDTRFHKVFNEDQITYVKIN